MWTFGLQEAPIERYRQQIAEAHARRFAPEIRENDFEVAAELPEDLAAGSTRWCRTLRVRNDRDAAESLVPLRQRLEHGNALGTDGQTVCRVLDVAPGDNRPVNGLERRTHFENDACAFRLAWRAARIRSESFNDALQQPDERTANAPSRFEHFFMIQRLWQHPGRHVGDAGEAKNFDSHVPSGQCFRHC